MTKQFVLPPWILFQKNILPPHIKTHSDYDNFYHRYLGKKNALNKAFWFLFFYFPIAGGSTAGCLLLLYLPSTSNWSPAGFSQFLLLLYLCVLFTAISWWFTIDCIKSIVKDCKAYQKYKEETK